MTNIFDYFLWRGDLSFEQSPLNPVDYVILSQLSYLPFEGIVPDPDTHDGISLYLAVKILAEKVHEDESFKSMLTFKEDPELIGALLLSERYKDCYLLGYINKIDSEKESQFAAMCAYTGDGSCNVIFRGTDTSMVGWKEDFNMAFKDVIPAQKEAVDYLNKIGPKIKGHIRVCGHSKGGNLAIYSSAFCDKKIQKRVTDIYSFDAPGFHEHIIKSDGFSAVKNKIHCYIPQTSIIGKLLEHGYDYTVIKSFETGIMQHLLFTWEVTHNDIVRAQDVTPESLFIDKTVREWFKDVSLEQRELFIEALYKILNASEVKSTHQIESSWFSTVGKILKSFGGMDDYTKKMIRQTVAGLIQSARRNLDTLWKKKDG
jgi:hypothetical protein